MKSFIKSLLLATEIFSPAILIILVIIATMIQPEKIKNRSEKEVENSISGTVPVQKNLLSAHYSISKNV